MGSRNLSREVNMSDQIPLAITERVSYITRLAHGDHPAGSKCFAERRYPEFNLFLEFEDGSVIELPEWYHLDGLERGGGGLANIEDRRCVGHLAWTAKNLG